MKRRIILVTGGAGFIGSNVVAKLAEDPDLDIVVCDWLEAAELGKWRNLAGCPISDFIDPNALFPWLEAHAADIEIIIHMGAVSSTTEPDADKIIHSNFGLSRDLFVWCAEHRKRLIYASSAATYGDGALGFEDNDDYAALSALRPLNAYGWSKALFDLYAARQASRGSAPPQWAGLKLFNVYGPNEAHKGSMKSVAAQIWPRVREGGSIQLFKSGRDDIADGGQARDFVYVQDVVDIVAWLAKSESVSGIFNVGSGKARTFKDLALAMFAAAGQPPQIEYVDMPEAIRQRYQYFTEAKMNKLASVGYNRPATALEAGIIDYVRYLNAS